MKPVSDLIRRIIDANKIVGMKVEFVYIGYDLWQSFLTENQDAMVCPDWPRKDGRLWRADFFGATVFFGHANVGPKDLAVTCAPYQSAEDETLWRACPWRPDRIPDEELLPHERANKGLPPIPASLPST